MLGRAKRSSCSPDRFSKECHDLRKMFLKLKYPAKLIDSTFKRFHASQDQDQSRIKPADSPVLITLSFKDQKFADCVHSFHKSENFRRFESYGNKAHISKPTMCCVYIQMSFVLHDPPSSPPNRGAQIRDKHRQTSNNLHEQFTTLKKSRRKLKCLIYEMLFMRKKTPTLNTQNDSIPAKLVFNFFRIFFVYPRLIYSNLLSNCIS